MKSEVAEEAKKERLTAEFLSWPSRPDSKYTVKDLINAAKKRTW
jgi:hypothetical protein